MSGQGGDPIHRLRDHLISVGAWTEEKHKDLEDRIDSEVMAAYQRQSSSVT